MFKAGTLVQPKTMAGRVRLIEHVVSPPQVKYAREVEAAFASWREKCRKLKSVFSEKTLERWPGGVRHSDAPQVGAGVRTSPRAGQLGPGCPHGRGSGGGLGWHRGWDSFARPGERKASSCAGWASTSTPGSRIASSTGKAPSSFRLVDTTVEHHGRAQRPMPTGCEGLQVGQGGGLLLCVHAAPRSEDDPLREDCRGATGS